MTVPSADQKEMIAAQQWIAVVAVSPQGVIGRDGDMPWRLSTDLQRFKQLTMGAPIVMGRKTFDSIGKPLPGRRNVILSRQQPTGKLAELVAANQVALIDSVERLERELANEPKVFVVGGATIYEALLPRCCTLYRTVVCTQTSGDTLLQLPLDSFVCQWVERVPQTRIDSVPTEFQVWKRRTSTMDF